MQICDICGEKLSKRERKGSIKRCTDCWEQYQIEEANIAKTEAREWQKSYLKMLVRYQRSGEQDNREWNKLQRKLAKVKAERDAARGCEQSIRDDLATWQRWYNRAWEMNRDLTAERDALETKMADMERDRDLWRADANALRDRWMAAVQENQMLQERLDKTMAEVEALQRDWKALRPSLVASMEVVADEALAGTVNAQKALASLDIPWRSCDAPTPTEENAKDPDKPLCLTCAYGERLDGVTCACDLRCTHPSQLSIGHYRIEDMPLECEWFKPKEHPSCDNAPASTLTSPKS